MDNFLVLTAYAIAHRLPLLIVFAVGLQLAAKYNRRSPRASRLVRIASVVSLAGLCVSLVLETWWHHLIHVSREEPSAHHIVPQIGSAVAILTIPIGVACLLAASFADRPRTIDPLGNQPDSTDPAVESTSLTRQLAMGEISKEDFESRRRRAVDSI